MIAFSAVIISIASYFQVAIGAVPFSTLNLVETLGFLVVILVVLAVFPLTALRSKDPRLRTHFPWFGGFLRFQRVPLLPGNNIVILPTLVSAILVIIGLLDQGYCLYRSATALFRVEPGFTFREWADNRAIALNRLLVLKDKVMGNSFSRSVNLHISLLKGNEIYSVPENTSP